MLTARLGRNFMWQCTARTAAPAMAPIAFVDEAAKTPKTPPKITRQTISASVEAMITPIGGMLQRGTTHECANCARGCAKYELALTAQPTYDETGRNGKCSLAQNLRSSKP